MPTQVEAEFSLQEAQHVIAREHGHDNWPKLFHRPGDVGRIPSQPAWEPVLSPDMQDIQFEADPEKPGRRVAEPADVVAYVQLSTADDDVALRTCYPFKAMVSLLETLAAIGRRGTV
jgi:hypothetical protein